MILPTIRASFGRSEALHLVDLVGGHDPDLRRAARERLETGGIDLLLDDPRVRNALLTDAGVKARPELVFYVLVRQAMLESGVDDRVAADYVSTLIVQFGRSRRAYRISEDGEEEFAYLVDLTARLAGASSREAFLVRAHMGNYSLWMSGLFPDFLESRVQRRGAPPISYYEQVGAGGYRAASESPEAEALGVRDVLASVGRHFRDVRSALNRVSDRHLWREGGNPIGRLLREVSWATE